MLKLLDIVLRDPSPRAWAEFQKTPWDDPDFSRRMLAEHLSQQHDAASRRAAMIEQHVAWIDREILQRSEARILDLGCGPGLYTQRLAALGHTCTGIDFGPASIAYARDEATRHGRECDYILGDLRATEFPGEQDLVMLIFGELNTFTRDEALDILSRARAALRAGGTLLLESHTAVAVRRMGDEPAVWRAQERGLFSDHPHIRLDEASWDAAARAAVTRHYIIDAASAEVTPYGSSVQAHTDAEYAALLGEAGFGEIAWRADWPGLDATDEFLVILARASG